MEPAPTEDLGFGVTRIDAAYLKPGVVSFYLLQSADAYAVIETGTMHSVPTLLRHLDERGVKPDQVKYVIPTHVHLDHAGGAGLMMQHFEQAELVVHPRGSRHMVDPTKLVAASRQVYGDALFERLYGEILPVSSERVIAADDGLCLDIAGRQLVLRHTPGHADHHFCVWDERSRGWFSGDVFGISYQWFRTPGGDYCMPATTPSQFRPQDLKTSIELLASTSPERIFLTHYSELAYSEQLKQSLLEQIDNYVRMAVQYDGHAGQLEEAIMDDSLERVAAMNNLEEVSEMRELFRHDAQLNAQGLAIWYQRQQS